MRTQLAARSTVSNGAHEFGSQKIAPIGHKLGGSHVGLCVSRTTGPARLTRRLNIRMLHSAVPGPAVLPPIAGETFWNSVAGSDRIEAAGDAETIEFTVRLRQWFAVPANAILALIALSALLRLVFAGLMGLGVDESYMVAAGRHIQLSYFDHPPAAWWLSWGAAHLFNSETELVVRLPFIALFGLSTWLMYRLGTLLFSPRAGIWSAVVLNLIPMFGVANASWVLPDGPLDCALLFMMVCLVKALPSRGWRWWIGVGVGGGLALLSKYTAVLAIAGVGLYLITQSDHRHWLRRPQPYAAALVASIFFSPVLIWNAQHHWASFAFQGGRAAGITLHLLAPITALAGESLFLLPWIWLPLMLAFWAALRRGSSDRAAWLLCCVGAVPVLFFCFVALWSHQHVMFHWAAPGYLMLLPLLGHVVAARLQRRDRITRVWLAANAVLLVAAPLVVGSEVRWNWLPEVGEHYALGQDPDLSALDWTSLRTQLAARHLIGRAASDGIAALDWHDAGKIDYALGGSPPVICLCSDPRQYGMIESAPALLGKDLLIVAPGASARAVMNKLKPDFARIDSLPPLLLIHAGKEAMVVPLLLGHDLIQVQSDLHAPRTQSQPMVR